MELKKYKLGECLELQRGYDLTSSQMQGGEVAVVGSNGIIGYHNSQRGNSPCITVGRSGSVGKVHYYEQQTWAHNTALFVKDFKGNNPKYLYYLLKNLHLDNIFEKGSSVIPSLDRNLVHSLVVPFHKEINDQRKIVAVLSAIDHKIELNKQINDNLEAMAKQLYDYWFVQFDFPNEEGKPYKTSGGEMVWNERIQREIPLNWQYVALGDICDLYQPKTLGLNDLDYNGKYNVYGANGIIGHYTTYNHEKSEIAMACRGNSCGVLNRTLPKSWITGNAMVVKLKHKDISNEFIKQALTYTNVKGAISGSGQPQLTRENLSKISLLFPPLALLYMFSKRIKPIVEAELRNEEEIDLLTKQRDELLPLLMNGQASVNYHLSDD